MVGTEKGWFEQAAFSSSVSEIFESLVKINSVTLEVLKASSVST